MEGDQAERTMKTLHLNLPGELTIQQHHQVRTALFHQKGDADELVRAIPSARFNNNRGEVVDSPQRLIDSDDPGVMGRLLQAGEL